MKNQNLFSIFPFTAFRKSSLPGRKNDQLRSEILSNLIEIYPNFTFFSQINTVFAGNQLFFSLE